tara:strand:- start:435 stop:626 length:192 start_codon:yes stop_codon:yes gene_type:complete
VEVSNADQNEEVKIRLKKRIKQIKRIKILAREGEIRECLEKKGVKEVKSDKLLRHKHISTKTH